MVIAAIYLPKLPLLLCDFSSCTQKKKDFKARLIKAETCPEGHGGQRLKKRRVFEEIARGLGPPGKEVGQEGSWKTWRKEVTESLGDPPWSHRTRKSSVTPCQEPQEPTLGPSVSSVSGVCRKKVDTMR